MRGRLATWVLCTLAAHAGAEPFTIVDGDRKETYVQPVGCLEPDDGGWRVTVSWVLGVPCKPASKQLTHASVVLDDPECTAAAPCALPRPGLNFRSTVMVEVRVDRATRIQQAHAVVNVLRHEPPFVILSFDVSDRAGGLTIGGELRVKLYKKLASRVDESSWRAE